VTCGAGKSIGKLAGIYLIRATLIADSAESVCIDKRLKHLEWDFPPADGPDRTASARTDDSGRRRAASHVRVGTGRTPNAQPSSSTPSLCSHSRGP